jgi:hypothetical protein
MPRCRTTAGKVAGDTVLVPRGARASSGGGGDPVTRRKDLPEQATRISPIRSTAEEVERAARRQEAGEQMRSAREALHLGDPDNPLRIPGEMSSRPEDEAEDDRPDESKADDEHD